MMTHFTKVLLSVVAPLIILIAFTYCSYGFPQDYRNRVSGEVVESEEDSTKSNIDQSNSENISISGYNDRLTDEQRQDGKRFECLTKPHKHLGRTGRNRNQPLKWSNVIFVASNKYTDNQLQNLRTGVETVQKVIPCIEMDFFVETDDNKPSEDHIYFNKDTNFCTSHVGRQGGRQESSMPWWCADELEHVIHEILHNLGLYHEHERPDRDDYIEILWHNINPDRVPYYEIRKDVATFGVPYNHRSILHYSNVTFSIDADDETSPTMMAKQPGKEIGSQGYMQETDKEKLRRLYNCHPKPENHTIDSDERDPVHGCRLKLKVG